MSRFKHIASREQIVEENRLVIIWRDVREARNRQTSFYSTGTARGDLVDRMAEAMLEIERMDKEAAPKVLASDNEAVR